MTPNPSLLPQPSLFSATEEQLFGELVDDAELDALVEALFPETLVKP